MSTENISVPDPSKARASAEPASQAEAAEVQVEAKNKKKKADAAKPDANIDESEHAVVMQTLCTIADVITGLAEKIEVQSKQIDDLKTILLETVATRLATLDVDIIKKLDENPVLATIDMEPMVKYLKEQMPSAFPYMVLNGDVRLEAQNTLTITADEEIPLTSDLVVEKTVSTVEVFGQDIPVEQIQKAFEDKHGDQLKPQDDVPQTFEEVAKYLEENAVEGSTEEQVTVDTGKGIKAEENTDRFCYSIGDFGVHEMRPDGTVRLMHFNAETQTYDLVFEYADSVPQMSEETDRVFRGIFADLIYCMQGKQMPEDVAITGVFRPGTITQSLLPNGEVTLFTLDGVEACVTPATRNLANYLPLWWNSVLGLAPRPSAIRL